MIFRSLAFTLSIALVVRLSPDLGREAEERDHLIQARRHAATTVGNFRPFAILNASSGIARLRDG